MTYVLKANFSESKDIFYVVDSNLTLSRNIQNAMIFIKKGTAELFSGSIENGLENETKQIVSVYVEPVDIRLILFGAIPITLIENF